VALVLIIGAGSSVASARVGVQDLEQAAAEVEWARAAAGAAGAALAEAQAEEQRLRVVLGELVGELATGEWRLAQAQQDARRRARSLYVGAGAVPVAGLPGTGERSVVRAAYAEAVGRADHEAVIVLVAAVESLEQRREHFRREAAAMRELTARRAELEAAAGPLLAAAEAEYLRLRTEWEAQEAARWRHEQEAAVATSVPTGAGGTGAVSTPGAPPPTTTTTLPGGEGGQFPPAVERWRPLVARYFPADLVEEALAVMACESRGDPAIVNPLSGTAGLFQHHPADWPARAAVAGFAGATPDDPEANTAVAAWLVAESVASGLGPWFFWACRP